MDGIITQIQDIFEGQIVGQEWSFSWSGWSYLTSSGFPWPARGRHDINSALVHHFGKCAWPHGSCSFTYRPQVLALLVGFVKDDIYLTVWVSLAGTILTMLVVVPPWPAFNKHPEAWLGSKIALPPGGIVVRT